MLRGNLNHRLRATKRPRSQYTTRFISFAPSNIHTHVTINARVSALRPSRPARSKRPRLPSPRSITRAHARRPIAPWRSPFSPLRRVHPSRLTSVSSRRHAPRTRSRVQRPSWNFPRASPSVRNTRAHRAVARARARFTRRARRTVRLARRHGLARLALGRARHRAPRALECAASNVPPNPTSRALNPTSGRVVGIRACGSHTMGCVSAGRDSWMVWTRGRATRATSTTAARARAVDARSPRRDANSRGVARARGARAVTDAGRDGRASVDSRKAVDNEETRRRHGGLVDGERGRCPELGSR